MDSKKQDPSIYWLGPVRHHKAVGTLSELEKDLLGKQRLILI